jgi:hypothetical protein
MEEFGKWEIIGLKPYLVGDYTQSQVLYTFRVFKN